MGFSSTSNTETNYYLLASWCHFLLCLCQLLSSPCKLRGLRQVGVFLLLLADAPVDLHLGTFSLERTRQSLCLIAQPTIALPFPSENGSDHPPCPNQTTLADSKFCMAHITHTGELWWWELLVQLIGRGGNSSLEVSLHLFRMRCAIEWLQLSLSQAYSNANTSLMMIMSPCPTLKLLKDIGLP